MNKTIKICMVITFVVSLCLYFGPPSKKSLDEIIQENPLKGLYIEPIEIPNLITAQDGTYVNIEEGLGSSSENSSNSQ